MGLRVTILQNDILWAQPQRNIILTKEAMKAAPCSDLYVLPEMWATGFVTNKTPEALHTAVESHDEALSAMQQLSAEYKAVVAGSLVAMEKDGTLRNRFYITKPTEDFVYYDKHHLFTNAGEQQSFSPGNEKVIFEWQGVRFMPLVCYDLRFPVWSRNIGASYDCLLYCASWPTSRIDAWETLLKARALENQCYVVGVNRVGSDSSCSYCGNSMIVDYKGHEMTRCLQNTISTASAELDMEKLSAFRDKYPSLKEQDL